jgi:two-component system sensor histidine kinase and response regulator WspE
VSDDLSGFSLLELFRAEAEGHLATLTEGLLALEGRGGDAATVEPLMRAAHSLKGAARIVGLADAERLSHALEDVFVAAQKGAIRLRPDQVDALLAAVDRLGRMAIGTEPDGAGGAALDSAIERFRAIAAGTDAEPAGAAAPPPSEPPRPEPPPPAEAKAKPRARGRAARARPGPAPRAEPKPAPEPKPGPEPVAAEASPAPTPAAPTEARIVRVAADNMNRLLGMAGASLVEARQLRPLVDSLLDLKDRQADLHNALQAAEDQLGAAADTVRLRALLSKARQDAARSVEQLAERIGRLEGHARRSEDLSERLHHEVLSSRLRPLIDGVRGFPRLVRDVARQLGKKVRFEVVGEQTGVDRDILEKLEAPLNHLIRNALDHGIEAPEHRAAAGKDETAMIRLEARHVAGMLQITLTDDGRGIDVERVRERVVGRGLSSSAMAETMTEAELLEFLFLPGFSTRDAVTDLSGRGVGLDVVQSMVQAVGGGVRVATTPGRGTCFSLLLPITMSVIRALLVAIGGEPYAFPLSRLDRIEAVPVESVETIEGRPFFRLDEAAVGLVPATEVLERPKGEVPSDALPVVVVSDRGHRFGVVVDRFLGERDLDVRPLDPRLGKVPNVNSASVLEDGSPVLIIDVEDLVRSIDNLLAGRRLKGRMRGGAEATQRAARRVLVVDDSITVRELERQLLESRGYVVDVAVDGMDGWNAVRSGRYDLVVSDVDMPRMDGVELVRHVKSDERFRSLPVVIVSYKDRPEDRLRGLDAGADCYLTKGSFHDETFLQTVEDLLGGAGP